MSILSSFYTGISGLKASGQAMGVIGDNIANAQSTGFKASRAEFKDVIAANLKGARGGNQIGRGSQLAGVTSIFTQGTMNNTDRDSDMAIRGDGFFVIKQDSAGGEVNYTRDGSFRFDARGRLSTVEGLLVQGFKIDSETGKTGSELTDIAFQSNTIPAKGTEEVQISANLDTRAAVNKASFKPDSAENDADFVTNVRIYDTTGTPRDISLHFYKRENGTWDWHGLANGDDVTGGKEGSKVEVLQGKLTFTDEGKLNSDQIVKSNLNFKGSRPGHKIDFNFGDAIQTRKGTGTVGSTQYGSQSEVYRQIQDGNTAGNLTSFAVDESGKIYGSYSNGVTKPLAQIALARFENNEGLFKMGSSRFKEAPLSGQPLIGNPGQAGRGEVMAKTLEGSTVDLASEFVNMIQTQRNFQANAKTITTSDELLGEVINLKR
jgi:flagellar hook protein FlgE